ncbi:brother of CDO isoform X1 [Lates japonicus]|uniref:Brother of CDO isoform X1 n=1 Tax=Lates japonicus TaxID=270547 RepID=A0AAD3NMP1_LATJO|nr:brother of CDO isoform X1 [Lates japonicus]
MQAGWVRVQAEEEMGLAVGWGLTEKKGFICVWSLAAEGAAECTASPGLCFVNGCLFVSYVYTSGSVWKMSGKLDWTPWMKKRRAPVLCTLGAVLLCCLQSGASISDEVPVFTEEPMSVVQKLGGSVNLRCSARPASANISWRLNGQELEDGDVGVVLGPRSLLIPTLSNLTLGRYQCVASTGAGALASVPANVTAAKLRDFEPDDQQEIEVDEGNTAVIECHLPESQPKAQVRYSVKQEWLETSKGNYLIMPSGNLQIANATQDDEGPYKCAAYNPVTQEVKTSTSADRLRIRRSTSEAARIIYPPASRSIMVTKGQRLVLECVASGIPTPQVTWAKDGQDLRFHNNTRFLLSNLLIDAVGEGDSGTYICRADNGIGSASSATVLYDVQVFEPPQVTVELQQQEVVYGETVRISCQTRGKPAPSVMWLHNARPLAPSPRHRLTARMLRVSNVGPQDDGLYQCMAENGVGSSQASTRLITVSTGISSRGKLPSIYRPLSPDKVLREQPPIKPGATGAMLPLDCSELPGQILPAEAPIILSQPRTGKADYYELTWRPRHERGAPVLEYMVKYRKVGDPLAEWTSSSISGSLHKLTLAKLQPDSLYEVEMAAKNCAGLGQPAMMTFRTGKGRKGLGGQNDPPKTPAVPSPSLSPPEAPDKPTVSTATETSAYVTWIPRSNRGFPIQSFRVEYKKYTPANNTPIYGFLTSTTGPTGSVCYGDYKKDVVEDDTSAFNSLTCSLRPPRHRCRASTRKERANLATRVILKQKARSSSTACPPITDSDPGWEFPNGLVPLTRRLPYLIVGIVLGAHFHHHHRILLDICPSTTTPTLLDLPINTSVHRSWEDGSFCGGDKAEEDITQSTCEFAQNLVIVPTAPYA